MKRSLRQDQDRAGSRLHGDFTQPTQPVYMAGARWVPGGGHLALGAFLEYLPVLACPATMVFCLRGMTGRHKQADEQLQSQTPEERRQALQLELRQIDKERLVRGEITTEEYLRIHGTEAPETQTTERTRALGLAAGSVTIRRRAQQGGLHDGMLRRRHVRRPAGQYPGPADRR